MEKLQITGYILLGVCLGLSAYTDLRKRLISVWICLIFGGCGLALAVIEACMLHSWGPAGDALLGLVPAAILYGASRITRGAIGTGDAILFAVSGLYLGLIRNLALIWTSCFFALAAGGVLIALKKIKRKSSLPLAPFALAAWAALGAGGFII